MENQPLDTSQKKPALAILGGTFDPVHIGHLTLALDVATKLQLDEVRLMPGFQPVHREAPSATAEQRLCMLQLAVSEHQKLTIDDREIRRQGPSYSLLSLQELRDETGIDTSLYFILGEDAFAHFDSWYQWQQLIKYCHLLIALRPGKHPEISPELTAFIHANQYQGDGYPHTAAGSVVLFDNTLLDISSTVIKNHLSEEGDISAFLPEKVAHYIKQHKIYG